MCKKIFFLFVLLLSFIPCFLIAQTVDPNLGIIPAPFSIKKGDGQFTFSNQTFILADSIDNKAVIFFQSYLQNVGILKTAAKKLNNQKTVNSIIFSSKQTDSLPLEGYRLLITPEQIMLSGKGAGLFYGVQTLIQLIEAQKIETAGLSLPALQIVDYPRFKYRGFMLDVSRHFFSVEVIKKYIDLLASYKLNNFHWHLTDDQGWRVEIKKYPKLTSIASQRAQTVIGNYHDRTPQQFDNTPYGGFYTQDEVREVVKYATDRYVNIVPEIEMPGHSTAVLAAYPELSCDSANTYKVAETWGVFHDIYCPSDKTFNFLQDVLTEVMDLFPGKYIHIGGDEVPKDAWKKSVYCQKLIKDLKLKNEAELQSYFIQRIEKFVNSKGRSIIGWDEILEGGLSANATVMSWRGEAGGIAAAKQNHDVIMTPASGGLYIDHLQGRPELEPLGIGGYSPLSKIYSYNPIPAVLNADQQKFILGVQANLWTEYIASDNKLDYMALPRLLALAEVAWSVPANKNYLDFANTRLPLSLARLEKMNFNFRVPPAIGLKDTVIFSDKLSVDLKPSVKGAKVYYSIDGYTPSDMSIPFTNPLKYTIPPDQYRELKAIVITPTGKRSSIVRLLVYNKQPLPAITYTPIIKGVKYQLFSGSFSNLSQLNTSAALIDTGTVTSFNIMPFKKNMRGFGLVYSGFIQIANDGNYTFSTSSANGSALLIDDLPVVENEDKHAVFEQSGSVPLLKGFHKITIKYVDTGINGGFKVFMTNSDKQKIELTADNLFN